MTLVVFICGLAFVVQVIFGALCGKDPGDFFGKWPK